MNPVSIVLLGLAMSTDAFAAAVGKGATMSKPRFPDALRAGVVFGIVEAITPAIGWLLGITAASFITAWDHWLAFGLLGILGLSMIWRGSRPVDPSVPAEEPKRASLLSLAVTGLATSIDAMAVGVGLAFVDTPIAVVIVAIGLSTMIMVTIGIMVGRLLGAVVGRRAEIFGGVILIGVGSTILYEHLSRAAG